MQFLFILFLFPLSLFGQVKCGVDVFFEKEYASLLKGKRVGIISNHTAIDKKYCLTVDAFIEHAVDYKVTALFAPEHGFFGDLYACKFVTDTHFSSIPVYSLHGKTRRPTKEMLSKVDVLIYDIQDIGSRSYTYISSLFYCMEEAAKYKIKFIVLDRPNPLGGIVVDGPVVHEKFRSFVGYAKIPYCHGMTVGELSRYFNEEEKVNCDLTVVPMEGWKRHMTFSETHLPWIPTSPQIPEKDTPFFYPATGLIGHLSLTSIGIGYTLPFKVIGAPWINGDDFAEKLNGQNLPGVQFRPFYFRPFFGKFKNEDCQGVQLILHDPLKFLPFTTQYTILGLLKTLYPTKFQEALKELHVSQSKKETFNHLNGDDSILTSIENETYFIWKLKERFKNDRESFIPIRRKYLNPLYS